MKYINKFSTNTDYQAFTNGDDYVTPNVCYIEETNGIIVKPYIPQTVNLITFNVRGYNLTAEEGMTWIEWCNSKYNTINATYSIFGEALVVCITKEGAAYSSNGLSINCIINNNEKYYFSPDE